MFFDVFWFYDGAVFLQTFSKEVVFSISWTWTIWTISPPIKKLSRNRQHCQNFSCFSPKNWRFVFQVGLLVSGRFFLTTMGWLLGKSIMIKAYESIYMSIQSMHVLLLQNDGCLLFVLYLRRVLSREPIHFGKPVVMRFEFRPIVPLEIGFDAPQHKANWNTNTDTFAEQALNKHN